MKTIISKKKSQYFDIVHKKNLKSNNSKEYWNLLKKATNDRNGSQVISLEILGDHYKKISTKKVNEENEPIISVDAQSENEEINEAFTIEEIQCIVKKLKNGKACGVDHIRNEFLKSCPNEILQIFVNFFNLTLSSGLIPDEWCFRLILPLYKNKGDINNPDNYWGITLLSCIGKLFTAVINSRLTKYLDAVGCIGEKQAGFREGYSTIDHIFTLHAIIDIYLSKNKKLFCAFIDYRKAFDFVDRCSLWSKLIAVGINWKLLSVIHNLCCKAKSCVKSNGKLSDYFNCNIGVRQGENLSPLLFAIFLNDFEFSVSRKYAGLSELGHDINQILSDDDVEHSL